jgi:LAO/AO transport system kinase
MRPRDPAQLLGAARDGDRAALARLLSIVEQGGTPARELGRLAYPMGGRAYTVGITGAPGAGKSTLTNALIGHLRSLHLPATVLAIDPSSPFSGGAILGDRVRMQEHATDPGVFIRSMATRGHLGGLTLAAPQAIRVLDAVGKLLILVETVGVGQVEVEVAGAADTTVVVVNPGWGDMVQANKAGLMEIADIFVINKADRAGVDETRRDLEDMLNLSDIAHDGWRPPVLTAVAVRGDGAETLWDTIGRHREFIEASGDLARRREQRLRHELREIVVRRLEERARELAGAEGYTRLERDVVARRIDPWTAADQLTGA